MASSSAADDADASRGSKDGHLSAVRFTRPVLAGHGGSSRSSIYSTSTPGRDKHELVSEVLSAVSHEPFSAPSRNNWDTACAT